jgi:hypothetical protein
MMAWWIRDAILFTAVSFYLRFVLGWSHRALTRPIPKGYSTMLVGGTFITITCLAGCFAGLLATNRQSWQAIAALCTVILNGPWTFLNLYLLRTVLPKLRHQLGLDGTANRCTAKSDDPEMEELRNVGKAALDKAQLASWLILAVNVAILLVLPLMAVEKIVWKKAHSKAFIPSVQLGNWAAFSTSPSLSSIPAGVTLNPLLEFVELSIGWGQCVMCLAISLIDEDLRALIPKGKATPSYVSSSIFGDSIRRLADKTD